MERRALIVESQNDFALSLASVLKGVGFNTSLAASAGDAQRELEKRRPDIVVLRAELPDQSGFVLCGTIRKGKFGQNLPVILVSSDSDPAALMQHSQGPNAANGYLAIPFEMGELARLTQTIVPPGAPNTSLEEMDGELDAALAGGPAPETNNGAPPPLKTSGPGGPPRLPRRERRSALTDEDKAFLDRAFGSIADRKTELLAESREVRRPPRRDAMGTPEAKIQILRDELKSREAQIARISEIWSVRERELLSVEDRLNEKDVEIQGLKMQGDDLTRRLNEAQNNLVEKEREHGRQVEDLLLQKFIGEKEVIEVVSAKEKEVNVLRREKSGLEEEVARKQQELEQARKDYEQLEKDYNLATLEFEVKEKQLTETVQARDASLSQLTELHEHLTQTQHATVADRDAKFADYEGQLKALTETLEKTQNEADATQRDLESKLRLATEHGQRGEEEAARLTQELADARQRSAIKIGELEGEIAERHNQLESLQNAKNEGEQQLQETLTQREGRITQLEADLADTVEKKDRQEAGLQAEIQSRLERIGELEGEVEAVKAALADREAELTGEVGELGSQINELTQLNQGQAASLAEFEAAVTDRNRQIETLTAEGNDKSARIADFEARLSTAQATLAERDGEIGALKQTVEGQAQDLNQKEETNNRLMVSLEETQKALLQTQDSLNQTQQALEEKTNELAQTADALAKTNAELQKTRGERDDHMGQLTAARNEIQRVTGLWRQTETSKAQLEEQLSGEIGQLKTSLSEAQGNYEAESAAREQLQNDSSAQIDGLQKHVAQLSQTLQATQVDLAAKSANFDDALKSLDIEKRAHADSTKHYEARVAGLEGELAQSRGQSEDLAEQLQATKQELGARVQDLTKLNAALAHAEDKAQQLDDRLNANAVESGRLNELLQNDLATKSKELADTLRKLTTLQQEKTRQADALTRDATAKGEQVKNLEAKLKALFDESKKKTDELTQRLQTTSHDLEVAKKDIAQKTDALNRANEAQNTIAAERDQVRTQMQTTVQQANARIQEANAAIAQEKAAGKKHSDDLTQKAQRAEQRIAQVQSEMQGKLAEMETRLKEAQSQLAQRQRRVSELEQATEQTNATRVRAEKELQAKIAAAESKANEAATRLAAAANDKKAFDAKHLKEIEDLHAKQKAEIERREQVKAQEVKRLQEAVQEKSKQLKVVELELARYKNKPATSSPSGIQAAPAAARAAPPRPAASSIANSFIGEDEEQATRVNTIPVDLQKKAAAATQSASVPKTGNTGIPVQSAPGTGKTGIPVAKPGVAAPARPGVAITAAPAQKRQEKEDRTVVMPAATASALPPAQGDDDVDFTSIVDNLGE